MKCLKTFCEKVNGDIWSDSYKNVTNGIIGFPSKIRLVQVMEKIINQASVSEAREEMRAPS